MSHSDVAPSPSEAMLAGLLAELDQAPASGRPAIVERYLRENPERAAAIRELVDADAGVRPPPAADANSKRLRPGQKLGPFRVVRYVKEGGMGEV